MTVLTFSRVQATAHALAPGLALALTIAGLAWGLQEWQHQLWHQAFLEMLVLAILLGMLIRNTIRLDQRFQPGIAYAGKQLLEWAIILLGASVNLPALVKAGVPLLLAIVGVVALSIVLTRLIGGWFGLSPKLAILVACGNSICGNSAIAAVAPAIKASAEEVASAISLTAVLGVVMVLSLPLLIPALNLSFYQYGVLTGMTVYAVPQVLAATLPVSALSGQVGTLVKLVRVLLLGPVVFFFALSHKRQESQTEQKKLKWSSLVPTFILGFVALALLRSVGLIPEGWATPIREVSRWLTVLAMAALGLGVDIRVVRKVGPAVAATVTVSLLILVLVSLGAIWALKLH